MAPVAALESTEGGGSARATPAPHDDPSLFDVLVVPHVGFGGDSAETSALSHPSSDAGQRFKRRRRHGDAIFANGVLPESDTDNDFADPTVATIGEDPFLRRPVVEEESEGPGPLDASLNRSSTFAAGAGGGLPAVKLSDFGVSHIKGTGRVAEGAHGTVVFMAPEVVEGKVHDTPCDVYSVGVITLALVGWIPTSFTQSSQRTSAARPCGSRACGPQFELFSSTTTAQALQRAVKRCCK